MSFHHSDVIPSFWCHSIILMSFHHSVLILTESFWLILSFWTHSQAIPTHSELKCRFCPNVLKISHSRPSPFRNGLIMRIISFRCHSSCCHWNDRAGLRMTGLTIEWQDGEGPGEAIPVQSPIIPASARHLGLIRKPLNHCGWGWNDKKFESEVLWFPFPRFCRRFVSFMDYQFWLADILRLFPCWPDVPTISSFPGGRGRRLEHILRCKLQ